MQEQGREASRLAWGKPEDSPDEQSDSAGVAGGQGRLGSVILRGATMLLDMLAWWPEAVLAGQTCLAALQVRQGNERE
jgi:hypothetical protein